MSIPLRVDFDGQKTRAAAKRSKDGPQARRLLALAAVYDGAKRTEAAKIGGVTLQIVRDWVLKFNALGPDGLIDRKAPGQPSRLDDTHRAALAAIIESGPTPAIHGVVRWRIIAHFDVLSLPTNPLSKRLIMSRWRGFAHRLGCFIADRRRKTDEQPASAIHRLPGTKRKAQKIEALL